MAQALTASGNVTNAGTATLLSKSVTTGTGNVTIQAVITKVSGTVGGSAQPQYSLDNANWINIPGATALTLTDTATQSQIWALQNVRAQYYRVLVTGTGTMVATPSGYLLQDEA